MAIGNLLKGSDAAGLVAYLLAEIDYKSELRERAQVIGGTMSGRDRDELTAEFSDLAALRPRLKKNVVHMSISFPQNERKLTDGEHAAICDYWAKGMGFEAFTVVNHGDHNHLACSRITLDGGVVSDRHDFKRSEKLIREIEERFDLMRVGASHLLEPEKAATHRAAIQMTEIARVEDGEDAIKYQLASYLDELLEQPMTASEFVEHMEVAGVDVRPAIDKDGKQHGFSYKVDGLIFTSETLGRSYSYRNLKERGLNYEPSRDGARLRKTRNRSQVNQYNSGQPGAEPGTGPGSDPARRAGKSIAAADPSTAGPGQGHQVGDPGSPITNDETGPDSVPGGPGAGETTATGWEADNSLDDGSAGAAAISEALAAEATKHEPGNSSSGRGANVFGSGTGLGSGAVLEAVFMDGDDPDAAARFLRRWSAAWKKYQDAIAKEQRQLAELSNKPWTPKAGGIHDHITSWAGRGCYRIRLEQMTRQLKALGCQNYVITILPTGKVPDKSSVKHTATAAKLIKMNAAIGHLNAQGYNIFVQPAPRQVNGNEMHEPYIFLDDLSPVDLTRLRDAGLHLTVTIKEAKGELSGWVRLDDKLLTSDELKLAAAILERRYGVNAANGRTSGRLAGMTNQDVKDEDERHPFIKLTVFEDAHAVAPGAQFVMMQTRKLIEEQRRKKMTEKELQRMAQLSAYSFKPPSSF